MAENKMTKKMWFEELAKVVMDSDYSEKAEAMKFINHEIELLNKKSSKVKPTKTQLENMGRKEILLTALADFEKPATIAEIMEVEIVANAVGMTRARVSALLTQLKEEGKVVRTEVKRVVYFSLA